MRSDPVARERRNLELEIDVLVASIEDMKRLHYSDLDTSELAELEVDLYRAQNTLASLDMCFS